MLLLLVKVLLYGHVGLLIEIWFTALHSVIFLKDVKAPGRTYLWMIPIYGLAAIALGGLHAVLPRYLFIPLALLFIYCAEASAGLILKKLTGRIPWDYGSAKFGIAGLVRLDYAPFWLLAVICFDRLSDYITRILEIAGQLA